MKLKKILILRSIQKFKSQMELIQLQELDALFKFLDNLTTTNHEFEIILSITEESLTKLQKSKFFIHKQVSIQTSSKIHWRIQDMNLPTQTQMVKLNSHRFDSQSSAMEITTIKSPITVVVISKKERRSMSNQLLINSKLLALMMMKSTMSTKVITQSS